MSSKDSIETPPIDQFNAVHLALGQALSAWGEVEAALCNLFAQTTNPGRPSGPAVHAFWAVVSFEGKLKLTDAAVKAVTKTSPTESAQWTTLYNALLRKSKVRNKFAHGSVIGAFYRKRGIRKFDVFFWPYAFKVITKGDEPARPAEGRRRL